MRTQPNVLDLNLLNLHALIKNQQRKALLEYGERSLTYVARAAWTNCSHHVVMMRFSV